MGIAPSEKLILGISFGLIIFFFLSFRSKSERSRFKVREHELQRDRSKSALADARIKPKGPLLLEGFRADAPAHEVLGVRSDASEQEIQRAYRELMKRYHPDKVGAPGSREWKDAQDIATRIAAARDALLSARKRP